MWSIATVSVNQSLLYSLQAIFPATEVSVAMPEEFELLDRLHDGSWEDFSGIGGDGRDKIRRQEKVVMMMIESVLGSRRIHIYSAVSYPTLFLPSRKSNKY